MSGIAEHPMRLDGTPPAIVAAGRAPGRGSPAHPRSAARRRGRLNLRAAVLLASIAAVLGCVVALVTPPGAAVRRATSATHGLTSLPAAAQGPVSAALGRHDPAYRVAGLRAVNPAQRLHVQFSRHGVAVAAGAARLGLTLTAYGYASALQPLGSAAPQVSANRVSYAHGALREWYTNGPLGLEQGFDLAARPRAGRGPLTLALTLSGDLAARMHGGSLLLDDHGTTLRYSDLLATDARGHVLRSWLTLAGDRLLIHVEDRGATYPLRIDPLLQHAEQRAELTTTDGSIEEGVGWSVAVSGDTIVVGAPNQTVGATTAQGAVDVFTMPASGWANATQTAELSAFAGSKYEQFGASVAITGNTIVVGAPGREVGFYKEQGAAYVFTEPPTGWENATQNAELTASAGTPKDMLGWSVAFAGSAVVAGAPFHNGEQGAAYVFTEPPAGWSGTLNESADLTVSGGSTDERLGWSVAGAGNTVFVGAPERSVFYSHQGAAYEFTMPSTGWAGTLTQNAELTASDGAENDGLGESLAAAGNTAVVGAPDREFGRGAAYVFTMPSTGWAGAQTQNAELTASDGTKDDRFAYSLAIAGGTILAGAPSHQVGSYAEQGAVYVFTMPSTGWTGALTQNAELTTAQGIADDELGSSVALSGNTIVAGATGRTVESNLYEGAAFVFVEPPPATVPPTTNGGGGTAPTPPVAAITPSVSGLRESAKAWREGPLGHARTAQGKTQPPLGTTFSFNLNVPARVTLEFTKPAGGRKVGRTCVAETRQNKHKQRCTRTVTAGALTLSAHAGENTVRFAGLLSKHTQLGTGSYTLLVTATASGKRSTTRTLRFTIAGRATLSRLSRPHIDAVGFGATSDDRRRPQVPMNTGGEA
jgi:trimeric autotransporter adhesin